MNKIDSFREKYRFLSNFYMSPVTIDGITYTSGEAAFQAQKSTDPKVKESFTCLNPSEAKKKGRRVALRADWEEVKLDVMAKVVEAKFSQNPILRLKLRKTGSAQLEEGNTWGDRYWGTMNGTGKNHLGQILMTTRSRLCSGKEIIILERENGWYGGYEINNGKTEQVFNTNDTCLFYSIKNFTDQGYHVTCLDKKWETIFMAELAIN